MAGILIIVATCGLYLWFQPLGPTLSESSERRLITPEPESVPQIDGTPVVVPEETPSTSGNSPAPACGGPRYMNILMVGNDTVTGSATVTNDYNTGYADVIRVARVDFVTPSITLLSIPRDLWVTIPGLEEIVGVSDNRLKTAYTYGNRYRDQLGGGPNLLVETLYQDFGLIVDHYVIVNPQAFSNGIDAIGGIDINLDAPVGSPEDGDFYFPAGMNHLDGPAALRYVRVRPANSSDLFRIDRQTEIILAVREKVLSPQVLQSAPRLIRSIASSVLTDMSPAQLSSLLCVFQRTPGANLVTIDLDSSTYTRVTDQYGYEQLIPDLEAVRRYMIVFDGGGYSPGTSYTVPSTH